MSTTCVLVSDTLTRFLGRRENPSDSRYSLTCNSGKSLTKTRFTSLIPKCSFGNAAIKRPLRSCVKLAFLISIQPGTSSIVSRFISLSWRVLIPSSNLVTLSVTRSPRLPLELVRGKEHLEALPPFLLWSLLSKLSFKPGHQGFNISTVSVGFTFRIVRDVSRCGQQLLVSHRQTDSSRGSLQATNQSLCN